MEYHMSYVDSRKSFKVRREKKPYFFAECQKNTRQTYFFAECKKKHSANLFLCRVKKNTRQTYFFAKCRYKTPVKLILLPSATNGHSANS